MRVCSISHGFVASLLPLGGSRPWHVRCAECFARVENFLLAKEKSEVLKKLFAGACVLSLAALAGCNQSSDNANSVVTTNTNSATTTTTTSTSTTARNGPDNSEITSETTDGVTTETRTFKDPNSRVERVVVTTRDGKKTARVYYRDKSVRELPENNVDHALDATGDALVSAGGKVVDVSKDVGGTVADKTGDAAHATAGGAKKVGEATENTAVTVGDKTAEGAKKVGSATARGAKKVGSAVKNAVTP